MPNREPLALPAKKKATPATGKKAVRLFVIERENCFLINVVLYYFILVGASENSHTLGQTKKSRGVCEASCRYFEEKIVKN